MKRAGPCGQADCLGYGDCCFACEGDVTVPCGPGYNGHPCVEHLCGIAPCPKFKPTLLYYAWAASVEGVAE